MKPVVPTSSKTLIAGQDMANLMGELIRKLSPLFVTRSELNEERVVGRRAVVGHWIEVIAWRWHDDNGTNKWIPH